MPIVLPGAGTVFDDERLAESVGQPFGDQPGVDIGRAARRKPDNQAYRMQGIAVREREMRRGRKRGAGDRQMEEVPALHRGSHVRQKYLDGNCRRKAAATSSRAVFHTVRPRHHTYVAPADNSYHGNYLDSVNRLNNHNGQFNAPVYLDQ
jgi:hypothetical protein